jgi:hypothetical protein
MPTFEADARFPAQYARLTPEQRAAFHRARRRMVAALEAGERVDARLGVKRFRSRPDWYELAWSGNGRALFRFGNPIPGRSGPHIIWLRIGTHDIYRD